MRRRERATVDPHLELLVNRELRAAGLHEERVSEAVVPQAEATTSATDVRVEQVGGEGI